MNLQHERIATLCTKLKLERVAAEWTPLAQEAARNETSYAEFLERLLKIENDAHRASAPDAAQARHAAGGQDAGTV
jgi:DNA replication protein DnaC